MHRTPPHFIKQRSDVRESKFTSWFDNFMLFVAVVGPLSDIPQIHRIYTTHDASGVSAVTFSFYLILSVLWLIYGLLHRQKPIILSSIAWMGTETAIVVGALLYGCLFWYLF